MRVRRQQKRCPATACLAPIPDTKFMCPKHWGMLPADLQTLIAEFCMSHEPVDYKKADELRRMATIAISRAERALP